MRKRWLVPVLPIALCGTSVLVICISGQSDAGPRIQEVMIPMRDGVRLQTMIVPPTRAKGLFPFTLDRGPYGFPLTNQLSRGIDDRYRVFQNIRGRFRSEGAFVMLRPPCRPARSNCVDETSDAWDTVDWLTKHLANNSGRAAVTGGSYDAWTAVMADFHHNGAFRLSYGFDYTVFVETAKAANSFFTFDQPDMYDWFLALGSLSAVNERYFHGKIPTWSEFVRHPDYDHFWQERAVTSYLDAVKVPTLNIAGWWAPEDFLRTNERLRGSRAS